MKKIVCLISAVLIVFSAEAFSGLSKDEITALTSSGTLKHIYVLPSPGTKYLKVTFKEAPFTGTLLKVSVNGKKMIPYPAFGGDLRYESTKGKPGCNPPIAKIEANYVLVSSLLKNGENALTFSLSDTVGVVIESIEIYEPDHNLPRYENSIYYDFDIWPQGWDWGDNAEEKTNYERVLLGILNGKGMRCAIPSLGAGDGPLWEAKRRAEDAYYNWGFGHQEFYTIWELCDHVPELWAKFVDVDSNAATSSQFQYQAICSWKKIPGSEGADVLMYDVDKYAGLLAPAIKTLAPYTDFYNFKCEQRGPKGYGFGGYDGNKWKEHGYGADVWASNHYLANKRLHEFVERYNPDGRVQEMHFWSPVVRETLYAGAMKRNQPMGEAIDVLMTHFQTFKFYDFNEKGIWDTKEVNPEKQYGRKYFGSDFAFTARNLEHVTNPGGYSWLEAMLDMCFYPEIAIDFNRFRLSKTEDDMVLGNRNFNRWANGKPFDFRAGLKGDELIYNSENGIYVGYGGSTPYQFIHGTFAYSLVPTSVYEPKELTITARDSLTITRKIGVNIYGEWKDGICHTKRLKTQDPLYGDMFGWTGMEYCTAGDYIDMSGIKDTHHRLDPYNAHKLVRRTCYAFVVSGGVYPAVINDDAENMIVKCLAERVNGREYVGIYAVNYDTVAHKLDITISAGWNENTEVTVFDENAWDWKCGEKRSVMPANGELRFEVTVKALCPYMILIMPPKDGISGTIGGMSRIEATFPLYDEAIESDIVELRLGKESIALNSYRVQVAKELMFFEKGKIEKDVITENTSVTLAGLESKQRYFWRVARRDKTGRFSLWSEPRPFVYKWKEYSSVYNPGSKKAEPARQPVKQEWEIAFENNKLDDERNIAYRGEIQATNGYYCAATHAVDGQAHSAWKNQNSEYKAPDESFWGMVFTGEEMVTSVKILWLENTAPEKFSLQTSVDGLNWNNVFVSEKSDTLLSDIKLEKPAKTKFFRIYITKPSDKNNLVGIRELLIL